MSPRGGRRPQWITLLSDFGLEDSYVGVVRGVLLSIAPEARLVDLTHAVPRGDVRAGAFALLSAVGYFPAGTIHWAVVDPGVGSTRAALVIECERGWLVGPDNGLLLPAAARLGRRRAFSLENRRFQLDRPGETFHGRDLFAPAAAHLARGLDPRELGPCVEPRGSPPWPPVVTKGSSLLGAVIHVDRFGNLISNVPNEEGLGGEVAVGGVRLGPLRSTYAEVPKGRLLALAGSAGWVEVAVHGGSAARRLKARVGTLIRVMRPSHP